MMDEIISGHPEDTCECCGRDNVIWSAPNDLWNAVARREDGTDPMLCPSCFIWLANKTEPKTPKLAEPMVPMTEELSMRNVPIYATDVTAQAANKFYENLPNLPSRLKTRLSYDDLRSIFNVMVIPALDHARALDREGRVTKEQTDESALTGRMRCIAEDHAAAMRESIETALESLAGGRPARAEDDLRFALNPAPAQESEPCEWTEGICEDGAAILRDGIPVSITELLSILNQAAGRE